jgi:hypothetical protein
MVADRKVFVEGVDVGKLSTDGKLHRIVGFFEPHAAKAQT